MPVLESALNDQSSVLVIADDIDGDAMQGLVVNRVRGALQVCAVRSPGFGESRVNMLEDLAVLTGTKVLSDATGDELSELKLSDLSL